MASGEPPKPGEAPAGAVPPETTGGAAPVGAPKTAAPPPAGTLRAAILSDGPRSLRFLAWFRRFAKLWGFALFCVLVVYWFRHIVLPFVFAVLVAYLLAPVVDRMAKPRASGRRPVSRGAAVIILYIGILSLLGMSLAIFIPRVSGDFARLFREAPELFQKVNAQYLPRIGAWIDEHLGSAEEAKPAPSAAGDLPAPSRDDTILEPLPDGRYRLNLSALAFEMRPGPGEGEYVIAPYHKRDAGAPADVQHGGRWERSIKHWIAEKVNLAGAETGRAIAWGRKFVTAVVAGIWKLILVLMLAAFILIDIDRVRGFIRSLVPGSYTTDFDRIVRRIDRGLSGVIRGQLIICVVNGILTYIGLYIFNVKYAILLAAVASVMSLIPIFGSFLSSIPIFVVAVVSRETFDLSLGLWIIGWIVMIHLIEANFLNPKIMGSAARTHPVLVVFALIAGEHTYGLVGALFAVPVLSIVQVIFVYLRKKEKLGEAAGPGDEADDDEIPVPARV